MDALTKLTLLFLTIGFQILSGTIGRARRLVIVAACVSYFGTSVSSSILKSRNRLNGYAGTGAAENFGSTTADEDEIAQLMYLLVTIPLFTLDGIFWGWSFLGLEKSLVALTAPRLALDAAAQNRHVSSKQAKRTLFVRLRQVLLVGILANIVFSLSRLFVALFVFSCTH